MFACQNIVYFVGHCKPQKYVRRARDLQTTITSEMYSNDIDIDSSVFKCVQIHSQVAYTANMAFVADESHGMWEGVVQIH